jgi:hypothetical protein
MYPIVVRLFICGACASALAGVVEFSVWAARLNSFMDEMGGAITIEISPDALQRDASLTLLLLLGLVATWSRPVARRVLIVSGFLFFGLETIWWVFLPDATFDAPEPLVHLLFGVALATAITLYKRGASAITVAGVAPLAVCLRFGLWVLESYQLRVACDVDTLQPPTVLNNLLYGASWIHVLLFAFAFAATLTVAAGILGRVSAEARSN